MKRTALFVLLIILIVLAFIGYRWRYALFNNNGTEGQLMAQVHYQCDQGKTIDASFYKDAAAPVPQPGQMPAPSGSVYLALSDGRTMTLKQTISADGVRYSDGDPQKKQNEQGSEHFVFWSKGDGALVLENNEQKSYIGCIKVAADPGGLPQVYESGADGISLRYPQGYTVDQKYVYQAGGQPIPGIKFVIDPSIATGTNLASDTYVSVEQIASSTQCVASMFLALPQGQQPTTLSDGVNTYSYASNIGAGAGNRYEEQVFALPGTNPCVAVRYFIHYGVIENYPPGAVKEFDRQALVNQFDAIRRTLVVVQ